MNRQEITKKIATDLDLTQKQVDATVSALLDVIKSEVKAGNKVQFVGFGTFEPKTNAARTGINPQTKEAIKIKASKSVKFKVGKGFKDSLN